MGLWDCRALRIGDLELLKEYWKFNMENYFPFALDR